MKPLKQKSKFLGKMTKDQDHIHQTAKNIQVLNNAQTKIASEACMPHAIRTSLGVTNVPKVKLATKKKADMTMAKKKKMLNANRCNNNSQVQAGRGGNTWDGILKENRVKRSNLSTQTDNYNLLPCEKESQTDNFKDLDGFKGLQLIQEKLEENCKNLERDCDALKAEKQNINGELSKCHEEIALLRSENSYLQRELKQIASGVYGTTCELEERCRCLGNEVKTLHDTVRKKHTTELNIVDALGKKLKESMEKISVLQKSRLENDKILAFTKLEKEKLLTVQKYYENQINSMRIEMFKLIEMIKEQGSLFKFNGSSPINCKYDNGNHNNLTTKQKNHNISQTKNKEVHMPDNTGTNKFDLLKFTTSSRKPTITSEISPSRESPSPEGLTPKQLAMTIVKPGTKDYKQFLARENVIGNIKLHQNSYDTIRMSALLPTTRPKPSKPAYDLFDKKSILQINNHFPVDECKNVTELSSSMPTKTQLTPPPQNIIKKNGSHRHTQEFHQQPKAYYRQHQVERQQHHQNQFHHLHPPNRHCHRRRLLYPYNEHKNSCYDNGSVQRHDYVNDEGNSTRRIYGIIGKDSETYTESNFFRLGYDLDEADGGGGGTIQDNKQNRI